MTHLALRRAAPRARLAATPAVADRLMLGLALICAAATVFAGTMGWPA